MKLLSISLLLFVSTSLFALPTSFDSFAVEKMAPDSGASYSSAIELSWPSISGASAYLLVVTENGSIIMQSTVYGTSKTLTGLIPGHNYQCKVSGIINGSQSTDYIIWNDVNP